MLIDKTTWMPSSAKGRSINTIEIDDNIADIICILNRKGYYTRACCEGHDSPQGYYNYIMFAVPLPSIPYGASTNKSLTSVVYQYQFKRKKYTNEDMALRAEFKKWVLEQEKEWAESLPERRGGELRYD